MFPFFLSGVWNMYIGVYLLSDGRLCSTASCSNLPLLKESLWCREASGYTIKYIQELTDDGPGKTIEWPLQDIGYYTVDSHTHPVVQYWDGKFWRNHKQSPNHTATRFDYFVLKEFMKDFG